MNSLSPKSRGRIWLYVLLIVAVVTMMWMLRTCSSPRTLMHKEHRSSGGDTIDVAIEYSPMSVYMYADTLGGFNYDVLRSLERTDDFVFNFHPITSLTDAIAGLRRGLYDMVVADMPMTLDYQDQFSFTEPVLLDKQVLVQRRDSLGRVDIVSQLDIAGKQVWVTAHSPAANRLRNLAAEIGDTIYVMQDSVYGAEQLFLLTAIGEIPRAVVNEKVATTLCRDYPDVDVSTAISFTQFQSWMLRKEDSTLVVTLNAAISRYKSTVDYQTLTERYLR